MAVVGIDLGTTNTVVSVVQDGQASTVRDADGRQLIPSVVSFHPNGTVLVGHAARRRRLVDAANTIYSIKRLIGRSWNSEEVARARARFPFEMREGPGQAALVVARNETFTLPEISAFVLRHARGIAEKSLGEPVDRAVITVPANFNDLQRAATKVAGRVAGLEVLRILNEPTAAALAYGYGRQSNERIAIYDFGGGTFDVTLLDLSGNVFEVLATAGNTFLGGDDIDLLIAERMAETCLERHRYDPRDDRQSFEHLRVAAERVKIALSSAESHTEVVREIGHGIRGAALDLEFSMTRAELETLIGPIVDKTFDVCRDALGVARIAPERFDQVILVGGSTRLPLVARRVADFFAREPLDRINPEDVVALGASIQANALQGGERRRTSFPKPPMPAARTTQSAVGETPALRAKSEAPPLPRRDTARSRSRTGPRPPAQTMLGMAPPGDTPEAEGAPRKRRTTGMGLGPPPPRLPDRAAPPDAKGGTLRGLNALARGAASKEPAPAPKLPTAPARAPGRAAPLAPPMSTPLDVTPTSQDEIPTGVAHPPPPASARPAPVFSPEAPKASLPFSPEAPITSLPGFERSVVSTEQQAPRGHSSAPGLGAATFDVGSFAAAAPEVRAIEPVDLAPSRPAAPLLVDVTPLSLCVETVSGYCDTIIARNTPVPCAQSRTFVTAVDNQTTVHVRVGQGESPNFPENTLLGQLELSGLPRRPRGEAEVVVTFSLDTDGILNVIAADASSGRETAARLRLVGTAADADVDQLARRHAARAQ